MGLLDFLHGGAPRKSEAELYMEKRNKEYARKAAEYKRREAMSNMMDELGVSGDKRASTSMQRVSVTKRGTSIQLDQMPDVIGKMLGTALGATGSIVQEIASELNNGGNGRTIRQVIEQDGKRIVKEVSCNVSRSFGNNCDECGDDESIYDSKDLDLFVVKSASAKPSTGNVVAVGNVLRGGFKIGDRVQIVTSLETRDAMIARIVRQGQNVEYANISSGEVNLLFANVKDLMVRAGDQITKGKKYFG